MKKVVCPHCGLINLEKFVTFPHCAGCGAQLGNAARDYVVFWKRPISALLWASILGICCAGLGVVGVLTARETRRTEEKTLVVYTQFPRRMRVGQVATVRMGLDSVETTSDTNATFEGLEVRFPVALLKNFEIVSIFPPPRDRSVKGNGLYYSLQSVGDDHSIVVELMPRRAGSHRFSYSLSAYNYSIYDWRGTFVVAKRVTLSSTKRAISHRARQT